jgi:predicted MFS family arabinose efflux permease
VATAVGVGALLSNSVAGFLAHHAGTTTAFLVLAGIAAAGFLLFAFAMPETLERDAPRSDAPRAGGNPQAETSSY